MFAQVKSRNLTQSEQTVSRAKLAPELVIGIAGPLRVEDAQAFQVEGEGFDSFSLVPVRYEAHDVGSGGTSYRCGVFVMFSTGRPVFLPTIGHEWTEAERCDRLEGVGFVGVGAGVPPRVLMLYAAASPNASVKEPVVLDWNRATGKYMGNEKLSRRLEDDKRAVSIAGMKRALRSYGLAK